LPPPAPLVSLQSKQIVHLPVHSTVHIRMASLSLTFKWG
jgi:hypothetical protein